MRRFLISYQFSNYAGAGFGNAYHQRVDGALPGPEALVGFCENVAGTLGTTRGNVIILAISEVSAEGEVVT